MRSSLVWRGLVAVLVAGVLGALAVVAGHRVASYAAVDLGPTDARYVRDFREMERDGNTFFRWSRVPSSTLTAPLRFCGPGTIRLRVRRHFEDPAEITVSLAGGIIGRASVKADQNQPYGVLEFRVIKVICDSDIVVTLESLVSNPRPLGVTVDWLTLESDEGFVASTESVFIGTMFLALCTVVLLTAGAKASALAASAGALSVLIALLFSRDPVAGERILRGGIAALAVTTAVGFLLFHLTGLRDLGRRSRVILVLVTLATLASRVAFLHTQEFYPDYRVHALVQQTLNRLGLPAYLDQMFEIQYARSLGLQQVDGRWYPFPYPPGAYSLAQGVGSALGLDSLDSLQVTAVAAGSLIPLMTVALGLALGLGEFVAISGAFFAALNPLLVRRMALGYYPGISGQLFDALAMLCLIVSLRMVGSSRGNLKALAFGLVLLAAFLTYTQSVANFGLLIATLCLVMLVPRATQVAPTLRIALSATLALATATGVFYFRYVPVFENVAQGRAQPESVVLERLEDIRQRGVQDQTDDEADPYAGTTLNPARGLARLGSRLWRFFGPFALALIPGALFLWRRTDPVTGRIVASWAGVAVWISVLAAGLPSPNGFQHLKDLEFVVPLTSLTLACVAEEFREHRTLRGAFYGFWLLFAIGTLAKEFAERWVPLLGI